MTSKSFLLWGLGWDARGGAAWGQALYIVIPERAGPHPEGCAPGGYTQIKDSPGRRHPD